MLSSDEDRFSGALTRDLSASRWRCSHPGPDIAHPRHQHATLSEALACGSTQAFLDLPIGADPFAGSSVALVQFLQARMLGDGDDRYLRAGRLATKWNAEAVGQTQHAKLTAQRDEVWKVLIATTAPAQIRLPTGAAVSGRRIGDAALALAQSTGLTLAPYGGGYVRYLIKESPSANR